MLRVISWHSIASNRVMGKLYKILRLILLFHLLIEYVESSPNSSIVISFEDRLEIIDGETATVSESFSLSPTINYIVSITSDGHNLFLSDYRDEGTTLFEVRLEKSIQIVPLVKQNSLNLTEGIAFDSTSKTLYFSDSEQKQISYISVETKNNFQKLQKLEPPLSNLRDVAIDSCNRRLYFVTWNFNLPRIEYISLGGKAPMTSERQIFIDSNLTKPRSLIYDYWDLRLYWIDTNDNYEYQIERVFSDSSGREVLCKGSGSSPYDITVTENHVFWSDWMNMVIWRIEKFNDNCKPTAMKRLKSSRPMGIASLSFPDACLDRETVNRVQSHKIIETTKSETIESTSPPLSIEICQNYCIHGNCTVTAINFPLCHCHFGYSGSRCQNDMCHNYCLNRGICRLAKSDEGKPICQCVGGFSGSRCQFEKLADTRIGQEVKDSPPPSKVFIYGFIFTSSTTGLLLILLTAIVIRTSRQRKGFFSQDKKGSSENLIEDIPHRSPHNEGKNAKQSNRNSGCSVKSSCSAVVDIEDCCQMTMCDTPCVEAAFRKPRRRGLSHGEDDKAGLLDNDSLIHKAEDLF